MVKVRVLRLEGIKWHEWGEDAFKKAEDEDKPVLLAISAVWCHWCHVMDKTSYSDPDVIRVINEKFIPVRVDNDRRPDINERYNQGGWPTTAFLTPRGDLLTGMTYVPPREMKETLERVYQIYREKRGEIYSEIAKSSKSKGPKNTEVAKPLGELDIESILKTGEKIILDSYDPVYGGFGTGQKFPLVSTITLCLQYWYFTKDEKFREIVINTLDKMGWSGMYDQEEGGFFRYSTTRDWNVPHFEKMLEDNSGLVKLYLEAFQVFGKSEYKEKALDILKYISRTLSNEKEGGFYGSQDADEEYYKLKLREREKIKAPFVDKTLYSNWNGMMISSYLQAYNVLGEERWYDFALKTLNLLLKKCYKKGSGMCHYYDGEQNLSGLLTDQVYVARALLDAYQNSMERRYLSEAEEIIQYLLKNHWDKKGGGFFDSRREPKAVGYLKMRHKTMPLNSDAASVLIDLFYLTNNEVYKESAEKILKVFSTSYLGYGIIGAPYLLALKKLQKPIFHAKIIGVKGEDGTKNLLRETLKINYPFKVVQVLDPKVDRRKISDTAMPIEEEPILYPCLGNLCMIPIKDPSKVREIEKNI